MHLHKTADQSFDQFRRERKRVQSKLPSQPSPLGYDNPALRELEQVEERDLRDQQLKREVHEFFAVATRQAAAIVERVAHDAEEQAGERIQDEVETFLMDTLTRMNGFIMSVMQQGSGADLAETHIEPDVKHLIGPELDAFRTQGTSATREAHIGQDPFATNLDDVQREFRAVVAELVEETRTVVSIEEHLVAQASLETQEERPEADCESQESASQREVVAEVVAAEPVPEFGRFEVEPDSAMADDGEAMTVTEVLETFKNALKALVRQGVMEREEARAAWNARLVALGRKQG